MLSKQQILDEIKRTAHANGDRPLGVRRFEREAGIKPHEWGKFWPRFGDAQSEAGFDPNKLQGAHADDFLIEVVITLARKLGKLPTYREIEAERSSNADIPTSNVFQRLGSKARLAQMVSAYCACHEGFEDVAVLCGSPLKGREDGQVGRRAIEPVYGEVYLFKSGRYYKIGRTKDTVRRGNETRIQLPESMVLIHSIKTDDPVGVEAYWHRRYEAKRMKGEWFNLDPAEVRAFKRWRRIS